MNESARPQNTLLSSSHQLSLFLSISSLSSVPPLPIRRFHNLFVSGSRSTLGRDLRLLVSYGTIVPSLPLYGTSAPWSWLSPSLVAPVRFKAAIRHVISSTRHRYLFSAVPAWRQMRRCYFSLKIQYHSRVFFFCFFPRVCLGLSFYFLCRMF